MHVYLIQNITNGKCYVGQTTQGINKYFSKTLYKGLSGETGKPYLYNAIRKYGKNSFTITVLCTTDSKEELDRIETAYIKLFGTQDRNLGYNIMSGGSKGQIHSEETKQKLRVINLGKKASEETKTKMSINQKAGYTEARRQKAIEYSTGRKHTEESKNKISLAHTGKERPEHVKRILLESHLGVPMKESTKLKIKLANTGRKHTPESIEKMKQKALASWKFRKNMEATNGSVEVG